MSKEPNNSEMAIAYGMLSLFVLKHVGEILTNIIQLINRAAWSLSAQFGRFGKFIGPPLNTLAIISTIIAVVWAIRKLHQYVKSITEFRGYLHEKVSDLKRDLFKEVEQIRDSLSEKTYAQDQQFHELEQKTKALMESIEERLKVPAFIDPSPHLEGAENSDSNALPR